jgi:hypothetical protein
MFQMHNYISKRKLNKSQILILNQESRKDSKSVVVSVHA